MNEQRKTERQLIEKVAKAVPATRLPLTPQPEAESVDEARRPEFGLVSEVEQLDRDLVSVVDRLQDIAYTLDEGSPEYQSWADVAWKAWKLLRKASDGVDNMAQGLSSAADVVRGVEQRFSHPQGLVPRSRR